MKAGGRDPAACTWPTAPIPPDRRTSPLPLLHRLIARAAPQNTMGKTAVYAKTHVFKDENVCQVLQQPASPDAFTKTKRKSPASAPLLLPGWMRAAGYRGPCTGSGAEPALLRANRQRRQGGRAACPARPDFNHPAHAAARPQSASLWGRRSTTSTRCAACWRRARCARAST